MKKVPLDALSKEELIEIIKQNNYSLSKPLQSYKQNFDKYSARPIAINIAYLGNDYFGLTASNESDKIKTVESFIFDALKRAKLIPSKNACNWARCGRTDKGVSSFAQVCSLYIRSNLPKSDPRVVNWLPEEKIKQEDKPSVNRLEALTPLPEAERDAVFVDPVGFKEMTYISILNRLLPNDIRVTAWSPVSPTFNARFSCVSRRYKYFFPKASLNIQKMNEAAKLLIGSHDFRNFCKIDPRQPNESYTRNVMESYIAPLGEEDNYNANSDFSNLKETPTSYYVFVIKGSSFLWHQVRCITSILFLIGNNYEKPEVITTLLDIENYPASTGRPLYDIASEFPLVLANCNYNPGSLAWRYEDKPKGEQVGKQRSDERCVGKLVESMFDLFRDFNTRGVMIKSLIDSTCLRDNLVLEDIIRFQEDSRNRSVRKGTKYVPLMERTTCDSMAVRKEKGVDAMLVAKKNREKKYKEKNDHRAATFLLHKREREVGSEDGSSESLKKAVKVEEEEEKMKE